MDKPQVCVIGGGVAHASDADFRRELAEMQLSYERLFWGTDWKPWLAQQLPDYDVLLPSMPNKMNAKYADWSVYFAKVMPFLRPTATLVGHSLGGIFLTKYLSENLPSDKFAKVILLAAPYDDETNESLGDFKLGSATKLSEAANDIHLFHSKDDPVVPFTELAKYQRDLPDARVSIFENYGHFNATEFPELLKVITS